jgi:hypothetical protein
MLGGHGLGQLIICWSSLVVADPIAARLRDGHALTVTEIALAVLDAGAPRRNEGKGQSSLGDGMTGQVVSVLGSLPSIR